MQFRARVQLGEALGSVNRWFCSQAYGHPVQDPELLLKYYIKSGGAADFALRFSEAMSAQNRWFCSECHRCDVRDPETLWNYYMSCVCCGTAQRPDRPLRARSA